MEETDIYSKMQEIAAPKFMSMFGDTELGLRVAEHRSWLQCIRHERPSTNTPFKVGVYIRYFNQTKHEDYLEYHKKQFKETLSLCPKWELIDFYVDEGASAPNMETAPEWTRLLNDCLEGKVDLIITQLVSNISKKIFELEFCSRLLAAQPHPVGIYFISEDIFTLASYYQEDLRDEEFLPSQDWELLPDDAEEIRGYLND